jgi:hypothetical protein
MEFYNTTTGIMVNLTIINDKTGLEWTDDLIGNQGDLHYNRDEDRYEFTSEDIDWWQNTIDGLEHIDKLLAQAKELLDADDYEALEYKISDERDASDYEMYISVGTAILEEAIKENAKQ